MSDNDSTIFVQALKMDLRDIATNVPKTDKHNHISQGFRLKLLEEWLGVPIPAPRKRYPTFGNFIAYLDEYIHPVVFSRKGFEFTIKASLITAKEDGVQILESSIDSQCIELYPGRELDLISFLQNTHQQFGPDVDFRPEIGINRKESIKTNEAWVYPLVETGYFHAIDLYNDEYYGDPANYKAMYRKAKNKGMVLKAHAGEYNKAEFVRKSIEVLELDEVQHGISIAESEEIMHWVRNHNIRLNICPTSNVVLCRTQSIANHPIRKIVDHGVAVSICTDDILVFDQTVTDEYFNLFKKGVFTAEELNSLRIDSLESRL